MKTSCRERACECEYLKKSQNLALIGEPSVDAHLLHLRNQNLAFIIIMMVMVMMFKITVMTVMSMAITMVINW